MISTEARFHVTDSRCERSSLAHTQGRRRPCRSTGDLGEPYRLIDAQGPSWNQWPCFCGSCSRRVDRRFFPTAWTCCGGGDSSARSMSWPPVVRAAKTKATGSASKRRATKPRVCTDTWLQPLCVVDDTQQWLLGGGCGHQAEHGQPDEDADPSRPDSATEGEVQRLALWFRQFVKVTQQRRAQLQPSMLRRLLLVPDPTLKSGAELGLSGGAKGNRTPDPTLPV